MNGMNGEEEAPVPLPSAKAFDISDNSTIQPPLTRRGHGPPLIILLPSNLDLSNSAETLDPPPRQKWAEEGFTVAQILVTDGPGVNIQDDFRKALDEFADLKNCDKTARIGLIAYNITLTDKLSKAVNATEEITAIINYGGEALQTSKPQLHHVTQAPPATETYDISHDKRFFYPDTGPFFTIPSHLDFRSAPAAVAHTRCLTFLKPLLQGPYFDLEAIWEEHTRFEFGERKVEKTMGTMVQEPYVNHIPTMTGGIGRDRLTNFYRHHFIFNNPADTALELVSRTVGIDRVIDEFVFSFTHDETIDWILPGIPPTHKYVEIPFTSIVNIRGDRLFHEHIAWDQATVLRQLGLMPEYLPFPYPLPDGREPAQGKMFEYRVPTAGIETAKKLMNESAVESNGMFAFEVREVDSQTRNA